MLTVRSLALGIALGLLAVLWTRQVELVGYTCQITESVPPVPALAALFLLGGVALLRRKRSDDPAEHRSRGLSRAEILGVYVILTILPVMSSVGVLRRVLPMMTVPTYFQTAGSNLDRIAATLPRWYAPRDPEVVRQMYEGGGEATLAAGGTGLPAPVEEALLWAPRAHALVPWEAWTGPVLSWSCFLTVFFLALQGLAMLLREHWSRVERLTYPVASLPLGMTATGGGTVLSLLTSRLMWVGFAGSCLLNAVNVWGAFDPSVSAPGLWYPIGRLLTEHPWDALQGLVISYRPEWIGLGYLVPIETLLSTWVFYWLFRSEAVVMASLGQPPGAAPYQWEQSWGAYVILGAFLLWSARGSIARALRQGSEEGPRSGARLALVCAVGGLLASGAFLMLAGMAWWLAAAYLASLVLVAVVYARIRAEAGAPMVWLFPILQQYRALVDNIGLRRILAHGGEASASILTGMSLLSRGYFPSQMASQVEAFELARACRAPRRDAVTLLLVAVVVGLLAGFWMHLTTYYEYGANVLEGGTTAGGPRTQDSLALYTELANQLGAPPGPHGPSVRAQIAGALQMALLLVLKGRLLRFPLSPLGFAIASAYSDFVWFPALVLWAVKSGVLRYGGVRLYRQLVPFFLGIALGHFFAAGVCLGVIGIFSTEISSRYMVHFG